MTNRLPTNGQVVLDRGESALIGLYSLSGAGAAVLSSQFTVEEETRFLIDTMRDRQQDTRIRLQAQKQLRALLREIVHVNGLLETQHVEETSDGSGTVRRVASASRLALLVRADRATHEDAYPAAVVHRPTGLLTSGDGEREVLRPNHSVDDTPLP